jgi:FkbM family methyltransferase
MKFGNSKITFKNTQSRKNKHFYELFSQKNRIPKYVLGTNIYAESIANNYDINGFIDDSRRKKNYLGKAVYKTKDVPNNSLVINAAGGSTISARRKLLANNLNNLDYFAFRLLSKHKLEPLIFNKGLKKDLIKNIAEYEKCFCRLSDSLSKKLFQRLLSFRANNNISNLNGIKSKSEQYFEKFLKFKSKKIRFFDVGGFRGETTLKLLENFSNIESMHIFEPSKKNRQAINIRTGINNIFLHKCALTNTNGKTFLTDNQDCSKIQKRGVSVVTTRKMDNFINLSPNFVKIDIEGGELLCLRGAKGIITKFNPAIAIAVYHKPNHIWKIPKLILSYNSNYSIKLRHYSENIFETIMYFIPKNEKN